MQFVDSTFLDAFTYTAIKGDLSTALDRPNTVVITKKIAEKYFAKDEDPLGKMLQISGGWRDGEYEVTAIIEDAPQNSHFKFDFLLPLHNLLLNDQYTKDDKDGWGWNNFVTYVQLNEGVSLQTLNEKTPAFIEKYRGENLAKSNSKNVLNFQPIRDIHLTPGYANEPSATTSSSTIYFFIVISIFIMAIAWVNYINLSTARALERSREVGIKKAIGAYRTQLISQFAFEAVLVNFVGVLLATIMALGLLPVLGEIVGKDLAFDFSNYRFWMILTGLFVIGSLISGSYPAFVLSSFNTTDILKGTPGKMSGGFSLRKGLVVFQFVSSLMLIAGTFAVYRQVVFMRDQDKGLTMDQMLIIDGPSVFERSTIVQQLVSLKNNLKTIPGVDNVTTSGAIPGGGYNWGTMIRKDKTSQEENKRGSIVWVDPDFIDTYDITLIAGKNFNLGNKTEMNSVLINEAAVTAFGLGTPETALHERIILGSDTTEVLGVLKNYHWNSLKSEHSPWLLKADTISRRNFSIHLSGKQADVPEKISQVEAKFKETFPGNPFNYYFLDDFFDRQYKDEQQFAKIFSMFAGLAMVIACLGLWGLASFTMTQKLKEIGIRKVLGASVSSIMSLLSWEFFKLVLIASLIAIPLAWYSIDVWLGGFAFRIGLQWDLFAVPVLILTIIALGTVSLQILRSANINPAKILRSE